jgi:hypothetical protein
MPTGSYDCKNDPGESQAATRQRAHKKKAHAAKKKAKHHLSHAAMLFQRAR